MKELDAIHNRDKRPLYIQAINALMKMIEAGELPLGSRLPSEGELADQLGISRSTLREALGHLETYGMVTRQQGRGTFVTASQGPGFLGGIERLEAFRELAERANMQAEVIDRQVDSVTASEELQQQLQIEPGTELLRVQIIEAVDGTRCMYLEDYVICDPALFDELLAYDGSMLTYLIEQSEPPLSHTRSKIFAISTDAEVAEKLQVEKGRPVLQLIETYYDAVGTVIGLGFTYLLTEHFYFHVTRRVPPH